MPIEGIDTLSAQRIVGQLVHRPLVTALRLRSKADDLQHRVEAFADRSVKFVQRPPHTMVAWKMGGQYLGSSTSVAANYRAARKARSHAEFAAKIGLVSEEADESVFWLKRLAAAGIGSAVDLARLLGEAEELAKIFSASARTARGRRRTHQQAEPARDDPMTR